MPLQTSEKEVCKLSLADIETILKTVVLMLHIAILVKDNFLKPKNNKKNVAIRANITDVNTKIFKKNNQTLQVTVFLTVCWKEVKTPLTFYYIHYFIFVNSYLRFY